MINILPLGFAVLCLWGVKLAKPIFSQLHEDPLSTDRTTALRGLLALVIILGHLALRTDAGGLLKLLSRVGYLAVAVFFFLTGYGLQKQHMRRDNYAKGFLKKRLVAVVLPYVVVTGLFWSCYAGLGKVYSVKTLLSRSIVPYSWYIFAVLGFYLAFWLLMLVCKRNHRAMIAGGAVWFAVHTAICVVTGGEIWWYMSAFPVVIGMFWAVYESQLGQWLKRRYFLWFAITVAALAAALLISDRMGGGIAGEAVAKSVVTSLFAVAVVLLLYKVKPGIRRCAGWGGSPWNCICCKGWRC